VDVSRGRLAPVSTGASTEEGAASTKDIPVGEGSGETRLGRCTANHLDCLGLSRFARGRETGALPRRSGLYGWGSSWTLRGGLRKACIGGIGYVLVPRWTERGEDFATDRTRPIEGGVLTTTVDADRGGSIAASYYRFLKASFQTALVRTSVSGTVVEESADWAGLCLFFAHGSRVTKTPALSAERGLGGGVGKSNSAGTGETSNGFAE